MGTGVEVGETTEGQTVVYATFVAVVVLPIGQSVTVEWQEVIVSVVVVYTVEVTEPLLLPEGRGDDEHSPNMGLQPAPQ